MQNHSTEATGTVLGFLAGVYKSAKIFGFLTWATLIDTMILSAAGGLVGLLVSHFGKKLLKKIGW